MVHVVDQTDSADTVLPSVDLAVRVTAMQKLSVDNMEPLDSKIVPSTCAVHNLGESQPTVFR